MKNFKRRNAISLIDRETVQAIRTGLLAPTECKITIGAHRMTRSVDARRSRPTR